MADLEKFRAETRAWLEANCPPSMRTPMVEDESRLGRPQREIHEPGLEALARAHGREGLDRADLAEGIRRRRTVESRSRVLRPGAEARSSARAPLASFGLWMLGPVLLEYANEEQKKSFLPKIVRGEHPLVPGLFRTGRRLRSRRACRPSARTRAITG